MLRALSRDQRRTVDESLYESVAAAAHRARLHWTYIDLDRGQQSPTLDVVNRLARALGVPVSEFFATFDRTYAIRSRKLRRDYENRNLSDPERGEQTPTLDVVNRVARGVGVTLAEFFAPFNQPYRLRFRKPRRDRPRRSK